MRINQYVARTSGLSRRTVDDYIKNGRIKVNGQIAQLGQDISDRDELYLDNKKLGVIEVQTILLNKPVGYVCSRDGQGSKTIYDLLPNELHNLKPVGRLDKDSSGLILMTNDGQLAQRLTHPSYQKNKVYEITLDNPLQEEDRKQIESGIKLEDGISKLTLEGDNKNWTVTMHEGRNRQIRRTFQQLGYRVNTLNRSRFGTFTLGSIELGKYTLVVK